VWNVLTGYAKANQTKTISSGSTPFYAKTAFTDTGIFLLRVETGTTHLGQTVLPELDAMSPTWPTTTATSPSYWVHAGHNNIVLTPIPTGSFSATTYYVDTMAVPSADGDSIQVGEEDLPAIVDYVVFVARLKEGGKEAQEALPLLQNFLKQASQYNAKLLKNALFRRILGLPQAQQQRPDQLDSQFAR
jgi:hypothetical protein